MYAVAISDRIAEDVNASRVHRRACVVSLLTMCSGPVKTTLRR